MKNNELFDRIRKVPDFPKPGILFYDITTVLSDPNLLDLVIEQMAEPYQRKKIDLVCGIESRGFIFGSAMASELGAGFIPIRKQGKLPFKTKKREYALEYGTDALEIHEDAIAKNQRVVLVDDLLATGGTAHAALDLIRATSCTVVGISFVIELKDLGGRKKLEGTEIHSLLEV